MKKPIIIKPNISEVNPLLMSKLIDISKLLVSTFNIDRILEKLIFHILEMINCEIVVLWMWDEVREVLYPFKFWGYTEKELEGQVFHKDEGTLGVAYVTGHAIIEKNLLKSKYFVNKYLETAKKIRNICEVPMYFNKTIIGVFSLGNKKFNEKFNETDINTISILGNFAAIAIENAEILKDSENRVKILQEVTRIERVLRSQTNLESAMNTIVEMIAKSLKIDMCAIFLYDKRRKRLILRAAVGLPKSVIGQTTFKLDQGLVGWVAKNKEMLILEDAHSDKRFAKIVAKEIVDPHMSAMVMPILLEDELLGTIIVETKEKHKFKIEEINLFDIVVNSLAGTLYRIQLEEDSKKVYREVLRVFSKIIEFKEPATSGHCDRVAAYSNIIGTALNLPEEKLENMRIAAYLHDIGKLGVPEKILHKEGKLDGKEMNVMQKHTRIGAQLVNPFKLSQDIKETILYHHEWYIFNLGRV